MRNTFPRRPSTRALLGAGLFATDLLRNSPAAWTDATILRVVLRPRVEPPLCDVRLARPPQRGFLMRHRLAVFLLFVLLLVVLPVVFAQALR